MRPNRFSALEKIKGKEDWAECRWQELLLYYAQRLDRVMLQTPEAPNNRGEPQGREPSKCLNEWS